MKEWECVKVESYKDIGNTIQIYQRRGWRLHTYTCALFSPGADINHYLLFERETKT